MVKPFLISTYPALRVVCASAFLMAVCLLSGCGGNARHSDADGDTDVLSDTVAAVAADTVPALPVISTTEEALDYLKEQENADRYEGGILPVIAENVPEYFNKLIHNGHDKFIVVDKASMRVILYDRYGMEELVYDMACARNYGTKHKRRDSRTPEGFFTVEGIYDSTEWLFTDDDGNTSEKKGQFGPRFIRLKVPGTSQIGIHGTCSPWSMGHRASHGCIRVTNENILELVERVEPGMPVIVLPGKRDRKVNREEGYDIAYFPTAPKYAMKSEEKDLKPRDREEVERELARADSIRAVREKERLEAEEAANAAQSDSTAAQSE